MTNTPKVEGAWPTPRSQLDCLMEEVRRLTVELENVKGDLSAALEANREGMHVLGKLKADRDQLAEVIHTVERDGWMPLASLPDGAIFVTRDGIRAVKSEYHYSGGQCQCILLESGEYAHFPKGNDEEVREITLK